ncbi:MAG: DUF2071 domain-containing protein [Planctomycetota bacterium]
MSDLLDRISASQRPPTAAAGYHTWSDLLFIHWRVPVSVLRPLLPPELEIDTYDGTAWLGLVPFRMFGVRPWWSCAVWGISDFPETNVRTYVHFQGRDPGVWFFSLDAAKLLAVALARCGWGLNYHWARMSVQRDGSRIAYRSRRVLSGVVCDVDAEIGVGLPGGISHGDTMVARPGTLEHFLVERYLLYARRNGRLYQGQVHHRPYPLHAARLLNLNQGLLAANQLPVTAEPCHIVYSPGVSVEVFNLSRLGEVVPLPVALAAEADI